MAKVITFSQQFPKGHPKAGEPTYFIEKLWTSLEKNIFDNLLHEEQKNIVTKFFLPKHYTIRQGNRFKKGEYFSPRVWSGKPYQSKQIILADDVEIKNVWDIEIYPTNEIYINGVHFATFGSQNCELLANNDGLEMNDFIN